MGMTDSSSGNYFKRTSQPLQGNGLAPQRNSSSLEENEFLRQLLGMQQTQMVTMQHQIHDLHSLVAGMASRSSFESSRMDVAAEAAHNQSVCRVASASTLGYSQSGVARVESSLPVVALHTGQADADVVKNVKAPEPILPGNPNFTVSTKTCSSSQKNIA